MKNGERVSIALIGFLVGGIFGFATMVIFIWLDLNPLSWFFFTLFICGPVGAIIAWRYAEKIDEWADAKR